MVANAKRNLEGGDSRTGGAGRIGHRAPKSPAYTFRLMSNRDLEPGIVTDLADRLSYGGDPRLHPRLSPPEPPSGGPILSPPPHQMLVFIPPTVSRPWVRV